MSTRIDDDDWFASTQHPAVESDESWREDEFEPEFGASSMERLPTELAIT